MNETIESVAKWADETFGVTTPRAALTRALQEMDELFDIVHCDEKLLAEEAADVCITLYRYIYLVDPQAIEKKMAINRKRVWQLNGDGTAQHLREERETNP